MLLQELPHVCLGIGGKDAQRVLRAKLFDYRLHTGEGLYKVGFPLKSFLDPPGDDGHFEQGYPQFLKSFLNGFCPEISNLINAHPAVTVFFSEAVADLQQPLQAVGQRTVKVKEDHLLRVQISTLVWWVAGAVCLP